MNEAKRFDKDIEDKARGCRHACVVRGLLGRQHINCTAPVKEVIRTQDISTRDKNKTRVTVEKLPANSPCIRPENPNENVCSVAKDVKGIAVSTQYIIFEKERDVKKLIKKGKLDLPAMWPDGRYVDIDSTDC